jgi:hypothetical protein
LQLLRCLQSRPPICLEIEASSPTASREDNGFFVVILVTKKAGIRRDNSTLLLEPADALVYPISLGYLFSLVEKGIIAAKAQVQN